MSTPLSRSSRTRWVPFGPDPHVTVGSRIRDSACQVGGYGPRVARVQRADHLISQGMGALLDRVNQFFARVQGTDAVELSPESVRKLSWRQVQTLLGEPYRRRANGVKPMTTHTPPALAPHHNRHKTPVNPNP